MSSLTSSPVHRLQTGLVLQRRLALATAMSVAPVMLAACSTLQTVDMTYDTRKALADSHASKTPADAKKADDEKTSAVSESNSRVKFRHGAYFNYTVAESMFAIQISAAPAVGANTSRIVTPPGPAAPGTPSATTGWTINGAITGTVTPTTAAAKPTASPIPTSAISAPKPPTTPNPSEATDTSECSVLTTNYKLAQSEVVARIKDYTDLQASLLQTALGKLISEPVPAATPTSPAEKPDDLLASQARALAPKAKSYVNNLKDSGYKKLFNAADIIYKEIIDACSPKVSVSVQQTIVPDKDKIFALKVRPNIFYTDQLNLAVDTNGFLTTNAVTAQSEVGAIATSLASDVGMVIAPGAGEVQTFGVNLPPCSTPQALGFDNDITCLERATKTDASMQAKKISRDLATPNYSPGALPQIPGSSNLPVTYYGTLPELERDLALQDEGMADTTKDPGPLARIFGPFNVSVKLGCTMVDGRDYRPSEGARTDEATGLETASHVELSRATNKHGVYNGLIVSSSRVCRIRALQKYLLVYGRTPDERVLADNRFWVQDSRYLTLLPTRRGFLVARSEQYSFVNGQPTGASDSRPSELQAAVSLPSAIAGALVSGITSTITNRGAAATAQTSVLTAQTNYLTAQTNYLAAQSALAKAKAAAGP